VSAGRSGGQSTGGVSGFVSAGGLTLGCLGNDLAWASVWLEVDLLTYASSAVATIEGSVPLANWQRDLHGRTAGIFARVGIL
jgi:hypothetical protein